MMRLRELVRLVTRPLRGGQLIGLDYRVRPRSRWGYGKPPHRELAEMVDAGRARYRETIASWAAYGDAFQRIPLHAGADAAAPHWLNGWLPALDAAALYGFIASGKPARYVEIGSGHSTRFARRAIRDQGLATTITSIDPHPRAEIDALCDRVVRAGLESADLSLFDELAAGDIVFFDGSHRAFQDSDVTVFFLDVLPRLSPGVLAQVHDIYLPDDYPPSLHERYYSEQYLLAAYLLGARDRVEIALPNAFITRDAELSGMIAKLWGAAPLSALERYGASFWFRL
jgi:hypothetical protein